MIKVVGIMEMATSFEGFEGSVMALAIFLLINSITPGPNNLMLLHGSIARGFWACR